MSIPNDRKYAASHEWIKAEGDVMLVGITGPAQEQLGDLVFVGDVKVGAKLAAGATAGVLNQSKRPVIFTHLSQAKLLALTRR